MIDNFIDTLSLKSYKPKTIKNKIVVIRSFIKFLYSKNLIDIRPEAIEIPRTVEVEANFLDEEEQFALIKSARNLRDKALIMTILSSGLCFCFYKLFWKASKPTISLKNDI